jgi:hypothetical protein
MALLLPIGPALSEFRDPDAGRLDLVSAALSLGAVLCVVFGIKRIATDTADILALLALAVGAAVGFVFVRRQRRCATAGRPAPFRRAGHIRPLLARNHQEGVSGAAPETSRPYCSRFLRALCRTRTGDPFLTMAVCLVRGRPRQAPMCAQIRPNHGSADHRSGQQGSAPSVAHSLPGLRDCPCVRVPVQAELGETQELATDRVGRQ